VCQMQVDGGEWEPLVEYVGIHPSLFVSPRALEGALDHSGRGRFVTKGVTAFRIVFPEEYPQHPSGGGDDGFDQVPGDRGTREGREVQQELGIPLRPVDR